MADEVPICDVLCEAMEYLSKLGSNLRARSESLKEKRIRKDKLKNSHAVQKAADKVLLICELSKKSLENVECGVRKVLSLVRDSRQGPSSAAAESSFEVKRTDDADKFQYFRHQSSKLKICKKVPVKHYMSAKVLARTMPVSMQDKYPVYYNCKLYRQRKRIQRMKKVKEQDPVNDIDANEGINERLTTSDILPSDENNAATDLTTQEIRMEVTEPSEITETGDEKKYVANENQSIEPKDRKQTVENDNDSDSNSINSRCTNKIIKNDERIIELSKKAKNEASEEESIEKKSKRHRRLKIIHDSSDSDSNGPLIKQCQTINKKENKEDIEDCDKSSPVHQSKKTKLSKSIEEEKEITESGSTESLNQPDIPEEKSDVENNGEATDNVRPVIKCVSLTKLLKPDVLVKNEEDLPLTKVKKSMLKKSEDHREQSKHGDKTKLYKSEKKKRRQEQDKNEDDEEYWAVKRKEVSAFKPKGVVVNITRLPKLSFRFLEAHKLNRITQNDLVICELEHNKDVSGKNQSATKNKVDNIHNIKNALLNDSDSEKSFSSGPKSPLNVDEIIKTITSVLSNESNDDMNRDISNNAISENCNISNDDVIDKETSHRLVSADTVEDSSINYINTKKNIDENKKSSGELNTDSSTSAESKSKSTNCEVIDSKKNTEEKTSDIINTIHDEDENIEKNELQTNNKSGSLKRDTEVESRKKKPICSGESGDDLDKDTQNKATDNSDSEQHNNDLNKKFQNKVGIKEHDIIKKCSKIKIDNSNSEKDVDNNLKEIVTNSSKDNENADMQLAEDKDENTLKNALLYDTDSEKEECNINKTSDECIEGNKSISGKDKVKNALLDDSDSEKDKETAMEKIGVKNVSKEAQNPEQVKNALLHESGSEHENTNFQFSSKTFDGDPPNTEHNTSNQESKKTSERHGQDIETRHHKSSKLKVTRSISTDDGSTTPPLKRKKHKHGKTPKWKKKHIMESIHAKKILLTYSSSSETEDEQLKSVLKEIKASLMKGVSSDDENSPVKSCIKRASCSSDSDPDILNDIKKKKQPVDDKNDDSISEKRNHSDNESIKTVKQSCKHSSKSDDSMDAMSDSISEKRDHSENESIKTLKLSSKHSSKSDDSMGAISDSSSKKMGRSRAQPGGSSQNSDSQDTNDKDIDGLTNLNNLSKNRRRRGSASTQNTEITDSSSSRRSRKMPRAPLIEDVVLKADSSSEAASVSGDDSDGDEKEDLPPVTLPGLNGSGVDHLAKDDLLDESDSSSSHNEETKNGSDRDENVTSKRRKGPTISSDSEAGSSRKKDLDVKMSDFEDSDDDLDLTKKSKRKKKVDESDSSLGSSSNEGSKKKRRRIKQLNDSDGSGSDSENEGRNKHGRKNIRKVMGKNQLEEATKKAAREEKERIARITERQKLYNNLEFDESGKPDEVVLEKVVLDFDPETKEPLIQVDKGLVKKLKPHQANGIKFMWDACFESVKRIKKDKGSGCILAHCMGLGKTLQVVSLTHTLLIHSDLTTVNRVLVVCPLSTVLNWVNEYRMWLKHADTDYDVEVYELSRYKQNSERAFQLQQWLDCGGVCVLGYEMFRNLSADNSKKYKKKMLRSFQEALVDPGPDLVVCDEGHLLKNEKTSLSQSMNRVKTRRRIVLTGTPLQNNLKEYYCMVQFVKPNLLGKYNEYLNRFVNPITNGQYTDSTEHDIRIMKRRSHVLHKMLDGAVQRRDYGVLAPFLPPKHEYVLFITLSEVQIKLYQFYLDNYSRRPLPGKSSGFLFPDFQSLQRIWTHPLVLKYNSERYEIMQQKKRDKEEEEDSEGSLADFIDDDSTPDESSTDESSSDLSDVSDDSRKKSKKKKSPKKSKAKDAKVASRRTTRANPVELLDDDLNNDVVELKAENPTEWWIKLVTEDELEDMRHSHKLILLFEILRQCETIGDKLLVFSQSLYSLDLIEHFLGKVDEATQEGRVDEKLGGHVGSWSPGVDYFRLDGSTSCENRSIWCKNFNREDNPRARLFLISTRAGGLGINLVAANRVVIFDVSWNPSHDVQSIFRVYRFGQKKPCYVYRFLAMGTMEEKIYERQVTKQAISKRVIDEQQIDRHYAENDLAELYKFEARPPTPRPLPPLPKDRLFAEMLKEHEVQIYKYHEHDSLLENKEEETLSEEERKAAWEDFENEKNRPPPAPFPNAWPMHNGMVPGLLAQQQQQLAYAALAAMLRKDMPNINDNQIRDMLPLIYNANPAMFGGYDYGLMQKMTEIYKYAPPGGMMNPGMMNPVMNSGPAGGGAAGGMGGSSGLQYEPPWQRQHQQQQQMRLQQLMQHQSQMGAKFYAGGLGSRDPVAMALQQQRAREIMTGETRGRPRGRPPLQPRAPPAAPAAAAPPAGDVVDLDSD